MEEEIKKLIEDILIQMNGKTFHSSEQVNEYFKKSLERVYEETIKLKMF